MRKVAILAFEFNDAFSFDRLLQQRIHRESFIHSFYVLRINNNIIIIITVTALFFHPKKGSHSKTPAPSVQRNRKAAQKKARNKPKLTTDEEGSGMKGGV